MKLYLRIAWRNIWRHKRRTVNIILAMSLSLGLRMWYDGLIDGFNNAIYGNAIRVLGGNIQIHAAGYREKVDSNPLLPLADDAAVVQAALDNPDAVDVVGISSIPSFLANTADYRRDLRRAEYGDERDPAVRAVQGSISPLGKGDAIQAALFVQQGRNDPRASRSRRRSRS